MALTETHRGSVFPTARDQSGPFLSSRTQSAGNCFAILPPQQQDRSRLTGSQASRSPFGAELARSCGPNSSAAFQGDHLRIDFAASNRTEPCRLSIRVPLISWLGAHDRNGDSWRSANACGTSGGQAVYQGALLLRLRGIERFGIRSLALAQTYPHPRNFRATQKRSIQLK